LKLHADLAVAHTLKELLSELWEQDDEGDAFGCIIEWIEDAEWSQIPEMKAFAKTLRKHWQEILNFYDAEITSGPLERIEQQN